MPHKNKITYSPFRGVTVTTTAYDRWREAMKTSAGSRTESQKNDIRNYMAAIRHHSGSSAGSKTSKKPPKPSPAPTRHSQPTTSAKRSGSTIPFQRVIEAVQGGIKNIEMVIDSVSQAPKEFEAIGQFVAPILPMISEMVPPFMRNSEIIAAVPKPPQETPETGVIRFTPDGQRWVAWGGEWHAIQ